MATARRARFERPARRTSIAPQRMRRLATLRFHVGHALIGAGSWLSGERVEAVRPSAHRPA